MAKKRGKLKRLPVQSDRAWPLTDKGEVNKPLIISIVALFAIIALALLLFFSDRLTVGQAIGTLNAGEIGVYTDKAEYAQGEAFTLLVKAHTGVQETTGIELAVELPGVSCTDFTYESTLVDWTGSAIVNDHKCQQSATGSRFSLELAQLDPSRVKGGEIEFAKLNFAQGHKLKSASYTASLGGTTAIYDFSTTQPISFATTTSASFKIIPVKSSSSNSLLDCSDQDIVLCALFEGDLKEQVSGDDLVIENPSSLPSRYASALNGRKAVLSGGNREYLSFFGKKFEDRLVNTDEISLEIVLKSPKKGAAVGTSLETSYGSGLSYNLLGYNPQVSNSLYWALYESRQYIYSSLQEDSWHHVVGIVTPKETSLYVDGVKVASSPTKNYKKFSGDNFFLEFPGLPVDQVRIFKRALTQTQIKSFSDEALAKKPTGVACNKPSDCKTGETCQNNKCVTTTPACTQNSDCAGGTVCQNNICVAAPKCTKDTDCGVKEMCGLGGVCALDSDGDKLPDGWEMKYNSATCLLDSTKKDSDSNGQTDTTQDYDKDGLTNYDEYLSQLDPCKADAPKTGSAKNQYLEITELQRETRGTDYVYRTQIKALKDISRSFVAVTQLLDHTAKGNLVMQRTHHVMSAMKQNDQRVIEVVYGKDKLNKDVIVYDNNPAQDTLGLKMAVEYR